MVSREIKKHGAVRADGNVVATAKSVQKTLPRSHRRRFLSNVAIASVAGAAGYFSGQVRSPANITKASTPSASTSNREQSDPVQPWGTLSKHPFAIWAPTSRISSSLTVPRPTIWSFSQNTQLETQRLLKSTLTTEEFQSLPRNAQWRQDSSGCRIKPRDEWLSNLSPESRCNTYRHLAKYDANANLYAHALLPDWQSMWSSIFRIEDEIIDLTERLAFPLSGKQWFSDRFLLLNHTPQDQRVRLAQAMSLRKTFRLSVGCGQDVSRQLKYWNCDAQRSQFIAHGSQVDVIHLFTDFSKSRLYRFPSPNVARRVDCFWTAANFSRSEIDNEFLEQSYFTKCLHENYTQVTHPTYGDLILFAKSDVAGLAAVHAATYLADGIVFTKNGRGITHPWMLSTVADVSAEYSFSAPTKTLYFRSKQSS